MVKAYQNKRLLFDILVQYLSLAKLTKILLLLTSVE